LPGKKFAYDISEKILSEVDDHSGFNLEFLEELMVFKDNEIIEKFIEQWKIDINNYLEIPSRIVKSLINLKEYLKTYKERGYEAFIFDEEKEFREWIESQRFRRIFMILKKLKEKTE
jgi:hypothetical protein